MADIKHIDSTTFEAEVIKSEQPVLVDWFASWCPPCKKLSPIIDKVAAAQDAFKIVKLDIDEAHELAAKYNVKSIPTLLLFKGGEVVKRQVGLVSFDAVMKML